MQVEVTRASQEFNPITVKFVIKDASTLYKLYQDFRAIEEGDFGASSGATDAVCGAIADALRQYVED